MNKFWNTVYSFSFRGNTSGRERETEREKPSNKPIKNQYTDEIIISFFSLRLVFCLDLADIRLNIHISISNRIREQWEEVLYRIIIFFSGLRKKSVGGKEIKTKQKKSCDISSVITYSDCS